jgi:hypothetical protein
VSGLSEALVAAQRDMPALTKDSSADTGKFTYRYLSLPELLAEVLPVLNRHGLMLMQLPAYYEGVDVLWTHIRHVSGDEVKSAMRIPVPADGNAQAYGSALSYARRYACLSALGLAPDEDDDGMRASGAASVSPRRQPVTSRDNDRADTSSADPAEAAQTSGAARHGTSPAPEEPLLPATEKSATKGQFAQISATLQLLQSSFPEAPGEGRDWHKVAKQHSIDRWVKDDATLLSMAEANELNDWLEEQYRMLEQGAEVPFG